MLSPIRTCIGCRTAAPPSAMLRLRRRPDGVVVWAGLRPEGRSAYLCPDRTCIAQAERRRAFSRAFRGKAIKVTPTQAVARARTEVTNALARERGAASPSSVRVQRLEALASRLEDVVDASRDTSDHMKGGPTHG